MACAGDRRRYPYMGRCLFLGAEPYCARVAWAWACGAEGEARPCYACVARVCACAPAREAGSASTAPPAARPSTNSTANGGGVHYCKTASLYGAGFYYVPGTGTCVKVEGWVRVDSEYRKAARDMGNALPGGVRWGAVDRTVKIISVDPNVTLEQTRTNNGSDGSGGSGAK